jgi:hypothetical protein
MPDPDPDHINYPDAAVWALEVPNAGGALACLPMPEALAVLTFFDADRARLMAPKLKGLPGPAVPVRLDLADLLTWLDQLGGQVAPTVHYVAIDFVIGDPVCRRCPLEQFRGRVVIEGSAA